MLAVQNLKKYIGSKFVNHSVDISRFKYFRRFLAVLFFYYIDGQVFYLIQIDDVERPSQVRPRRSKKEKEKKIHLKGLAVYLMKRHTHHRDAEMKIECTIDI